MHFIDFSTAVITLLTAVSQSQSQSQNETCIAPLTKLDSGAEQNSILKHTIKYIYIV